MNETPILILVQIKSWDLSDISPTLKLISINFTGIVTQSVVWYQERISLSERLSLGQLRRANIFFTRLVLDVSV